MRRDLTIAQHAAAKEKAERAIGSAVSAALTAFSEETGGGIRNVEIKLIEHWSAQGARTLDESVCLGVTVTTSLENYAK